MKRRLKVWNIEHQPKYGVAKEEEQAREVKHIQQKCSERLIVHIVEELNRDFVKKTVTFLSTLTKKIEKTIADEISLPRLPSDSFGSSDNLKNPE